MKAEQIGADVATVILRAADAGPTYVYWLWLDEPDAPQFDVVRGNGALKALASALINPGRRGHEAIAHALSDGAFADPGRERSLMTRLAKEVLPEKLAERITSRANGGEHVLIRVTPSPRIAQVPWELLVLPSGERLLDIAEIRYEPPSTVHARRAARPGANSPIRGALRVLDPVTAGNSLELGRLLPDAREAEFLRSNLPDAHVGTQVHRAWLGEQLRQHPTRFLYFGHVSSSHEDPGSSSMHLSDDAATYGLASAWEDSGHRPLSALDLLLGTTEVTSRRSDYEYPYNESVGGHQIWPMPRRVALIACESGGDLKSVETFGLVIAILNSGAELVTATRWKLPSDSTFRAFIDSDVGPQPTSELVVAVDRAHESDDPFASIRDWQLKRLRHWESDEWHLVDTPLVWASLASYFAPARDVEEVPTQAG